MPKQKVVWVLVDPPEPDPRSEQERHDDHVASRIEGDLFLEPLFQKELTRIRARRMAAAASREYTRNVLDQNELFRDPEADEFMCAEITVNVAAYSTPDATIGEEPPIVTALVEIGERPVNCGVGIPLPAPLRQSDTGLAALAKGPPDDGEFEGKIDRSVDLDRVPSPKDAIKARPKRGKPFEPGQSGNLKGRPKGSRNRATLLAEELLHGSTEALTAQAIAKALAGNDHLLQFLLRFILRSSRDAPIDLKLPALTSRATCRKALEILIKAGASGEIPPGAVELLSEPIRQLMLTLGFRDEDDFRQ